MSQLDRVFPMNLYALHSTNIGINVYSGYETIVLDRVNTPTITNFAITVKNNNNSGNLTKINVYGSPNGIDYFLYADHLFSGVIAPHKIEHREFTMVSLFVRIAVESDADINIDMYLHGSLA